MDTENKCFPLRVILHIHAAGIILAEDVAVVLKEFKSQ